MSLGTSAPTSKTGNGSFFKWFDSPKVLGQTGNDLIYWTVGSVAAIDFAAKFFNVNLAASVVPSLSGMQMAAVDVALLGLAISQVSVENIAIQRTFNSVGHLLLIGTLAVVLSDSNNPAEVVQKVANSPEIQQVRYQYAGGGVASTAPLKSYNIESCSFYNPLIGRKLNPEEINWCKGLGNTMTDHQAKSCGCK